MKVFLTCCGVFEILCHLPSPLLVDCVADNAHVNNIKNFGKYDPVPGWNITCQDRGKPGEVPQIGTIGPIATLQCIATIATIATCLTLQQMPQFGPIATIATMAQKSSVLL